MVYNESNKQERRQGTEDRGKKVDLSTAFFVCCLLAMFQTKRAVQFPDSPFELKVPTLFTRLPTSCRTFHDFQQLGLLFFQE
jgi:hypothetical protein